MNALKKLSVAFTLTLVTFTNVGAMQSTAFAQSIERSTISRQVYNDFVLEPGRQEIKLKPGESTTRQFSITNRSRDGLVFSLTAEDIIGSENSDEPVILLGDQKGPYSLKDLVSFPVTEVTIDLGEKVTIPFTITIPEDATPGGRYGALIASNAPSKEGVTQGTGTTIVSRLGSILLVKVEGNVKEGGSVQEIRIQGGKKFYWTKGPSGFEILFKNTGNVHLVPYGTISITNLVGSELANLPVDAYFALPDSVRYRLVEWESSMMFGRYKATAEMTRGYGNQKDLVSVVFWVLPIKFIVITLLALLALYGLIKFVGSRFEFKRK